MARAEWVDTVVAMKPFWLVRTLSGISMDLGISLLVYNLMRTALDRGPAPAGERVAMPGRSPARA
jgi:cytochrome c oxidase cbb3-type subunit 1